MNHRVEHLYQVRVYDSSDNTLAVYDDLVSVVYKRQVNHIGMAILTVPEGHDILQYAVKDTLFEIWISYPRLVPNPVTFSQDWANDFTGLFRDRQIATDPNGNIYHLLYIPDAIESLSRHVVAWPAGSGGKNHWIGQRLSVIANDIVRWNCTEEATVANGRLRDATVVHGLEDAGAIPGTDVVDYSVSPGRNVLDFLQEIAPICGFDFTVERHPSHPGELRVRQLLGQLGTDRSSNVIFDLALDNISSTSLSFDGLREKTIAIVGGAGEGAARTFVIRAGVNYAPNNDYEHWVDARDRDDDELPAVGDAVLGNYEARAQLRSDVMSSRGWVYRRDFEHGDLVTAQFAGFSAIKKIGTTEVRFDQSQRMAVLLELIEP
ncbi:MAG: hypothetical protein UZ13_01515 [Chloroflexi bacterium OLB13]|nr:MAG: hypothetical protein UZ13_01515 [Chloroflexi bacterium OLB13]RIK36782.1 MAG: hypothetical protein DCC55_26285 [Chloroflexota bacterium]